mgnify:CR=1 FL=1
MFLYQSWVAATAHWPQTAYDADSTTCPVLANRALWRATASAAPGWCYPASNLIGKVYDHLVNGDSVDRIKRTLNVMTAPETYQRPQTDASKGEINAAERAFKKLGLEPALDRRVATVADISKAGWASWVSPLAPVAEWEKDRKTPELRKSDAAVTAAEAEAKGKQGQIPGAAVEAAPVKKSDADDKSEDVVVGYHELVTKVLPTAAAMWVQAHERGYYGSMTTQTKYNAPPLMKWDVTAAVYKNVGEAAQAGKGDSNGDKTQGETEVAAPESDEAVASDKGEDADYTAAKATVKAGAATEATSATEAKSEDAKNDVSNNIPSAPQPADQTKDDVAYADVDVDEFGGRDCNCEYTHASDCTHYTAKFDRDTARNPFDFYVYIVQSNAFDFSLSLTPTAWHPCTSVLSCPAHFRNANGQTQEDPIMMLTLAGACDVKSSKMALFPGSLRSDLHGVRRVIEEFSDKMGLKRVPARFAGREATGITLWKLEEASAAVVRVRDQDGSVKQYTIKFTGYSPAESAF